MLYGDWIGRWGQSYSDKEALVDAIKNRRYTYGKLSEEINKMANFMRKELGIVKGDRISILSLSSAEYMILFFATIRLGAMFVPLNSRLAPAEFIYYLTDSEPKAIFFDKHHQQIVAGFKQKVEIPHYICLDNDASEGVSLPAIWDGLSAKRPPEVDIKENDPALVIYTAGTTGLPKGALLTHGTITWNSFNSVIGWGLTGSDSTTIHFPLYYTGGWNAVTLPIFHCHGKCVLLAGFDPKQLLDVIEKEKITFCGGVPTMLMMMMTAPNFKTANLSSLRTIGNGGAPLTKQIYDAFTARGVKMFEGYGLTEAGPNNFIGDGKLGTVGKPMPHVDMKIVDDDGREVAPGEEGELLIRGGHLFGGYWKKPEATAEALAGGWFHTGDLFKVDADGDYSVVGRKKDMIKSGGINVYPAEIEMHIGTHPSVAIAAVIGVKDEKWNEVGKAVIKLKPGQKLTLEELQKYLEERLGKFKIPKYMVIVDNMPITVAKGTVQKFILKKEHGNPDNN